MMNLRDLYMYPHDIGASSLYSMPLFFATPSQWNFPCSTLSLCQNRSRPNFVGHTFAQTLDWNVGMHPSFLHYPSCLPRLVWVRVEFSDVTFCGMWLQRVARAESSFPSLPNDSSLNHLLLQTLLLTLLPCINWGIGSRKHQLSAVLWLMEQWYTHKYIHTV